MSATESSQASLERARQTYREAGPKAALPEYERALELFRDQGDDLGEAITLGYLGNCHKRLGDFEQALELLEAALAQKQALGVKLETGKTLSHLGLLYWEMGEYEPAIQYLERSLALAREVQDSRLEGASLNNLSLVYDELGDYDRSLEQYERALKIFRDLEDPDGESYTLGNIGGVYLLLGRYRQAMAYYRQSMAIGEKLGLKPSLSHDLGNLAMCQLGLGDFDEAHQSITQALQLARETGLRQDEAYWLRVEGSVLFAQGRYGLGLESYRRGLQIYRELEADGELVEALSELGGVYLALGDVASAESQFLQAADLGRASGHSRGLTFALLQLGDLEWRRGKLGAAEALVTQALGRATEAGEMDQACRAQLQLALTHKDQERLDMAEKRVAEALDIARQIEASRLESQALWVGGEIRREGGRFDEALDHYAQGLRVAGRTGDPDVLWRLHHGRGRALVARGDNEGAVDAYRAAVEVIESVRSRVREDRFRAGYLEDKHEIYIELVRLLLEMGQLEDAFRTAEQLRSRNFLALLNRGLPPGRTASERQREIELRERIRRLEEALEEESDGSLQQQRDMAVEVYSRELVDAESEYQAFLDDHLVSDEIYPGLRSLDIPSVEQIVKTLPQGTAIAEFVVAEDAVVAFVLTARGLEATSVPIGREQIIVKVELLRDLVQRRDSALWREPASSLGADLIKPLEEEGWLAGIRQLKVVPHGVLHYLPFSLLLRPTDQGPRLLVEDYVVAYLPSVAASMIDGPETVVARNLLALAPSRSGLPWAAEEVRGLEGLYPDRSLVLVGERASESAFKRQAPGYQTLHLATHGHFNRLNPLLSGLELEPEGSDDGRLEVHEILRLPLRAKLVTLSACDTALGSGFFTELPIGDDFVGLTRSFLLAGSSSVMATLWKVDDRSTQRLMQTFYGELNENPGIALPGALVTAQRAMIEAGGAHSHPYHWAPFVLVGTLE